MIENDENPQSWPPIPQGKSQSKAIDRAQRKTQPLNFQDYFLQICTFKRYETDCGCGSTLLHATPTFKNRSKTYGAPCIVRLPKSAGARHYCPKILLVPGTLGTLGTLAKLSQALLTTIDFYSDYIES